MTRSEVPDLVTIPRAELDALYARLAKAESYRENDRERSRRSHAARRRADASPVTADGAGRPEVLTRPVTQDGRNRPGPVTGDGPQPVTPIGPGRPEASPRPVTQDGPGRPDGEFDLESVAGRAPSRAPAYSPPPPDLKHGGGAGGLGGPTPLRPPPNVVPLDEAVFARLWAEPRIVAVVERRGLDVAWERANFRRKPQGCDPKNWTIEYLEAWLLRSAVRVDDPSMVHRKVPDRPHRQNGIAAVGAYDHDPWAGRKPPIAEADLERYGALGSS